MKILLINPWIYDFAAFDLWSKPLGLLYLASILRDQGHQIFLIDCMDRWHPGIQKIAGVKYAARDKKYGCGHYYKMEVPKPECFKNIPRRFGRYGIPEKCFLKEIQECGTPDLILITSGMTYWYPGVRYAVQLIRQQSSDIPIALGGMYASLCPEHAVAYSGADSVFTGECESRMNEVLAIGQSNELLQAPAYPDLDDIPYPAFDVYSRLPYLPILTSRGCPYRCPFCASGRISGRFRKRSPQLVAEEIRYWHKKTHVRDIAFFDDALLVHKDRHFHVIIEELKRHGLPLRFHTPNAMFPAMLDAETAVVMRQARFKTIRLSLETVSQQRYEEMQGKVTRETFVQGLEALIAAGFQAKDIESYIIYGLPDQTIAEVIETVIFAGSLGVKLRPCDFSPIPGTDEYRKAVAAGEYDPEWDLLMSNNSVLGFRSNIFTPDRIEELKKFVKVVNYASEIGLNLFAKSSIARQLQKFFSPALVDDTMDRLQR